MPTTSAAVRLVAMVMIVVVLATVVTPAPAEADVLTTLAIVSLAITGVILIIYLIAAVGSEVSDARLEEPPGVRVAGVGQTP